MFKIYKKIIIQLLFTILGLQILAFIFGQRFLFFNNQIILLNFIFSFLLILFCSLILLPIFKIIEKSQKKYDDDRVKKFENKLMQLKTNKEKGDFEKINRKK